MSYANLDGVPSQSPGVTEVLAEDWNTYVRDNFDTLKRGHVRVANEAGLSGLTVAIGTMVFAEAEESLWVFASSGWVRAIGTNDLRDNSVTAAKIAANAVETAKINNGAVTGAKIAEGYTFRQTLVFNFSGGTFSKASYPWLRAVRARVQAAGGGGGGSAGTDGSSRSAGSGAGGGGYAERFRTDISALAANETITVGGGGGSTGPGGNSVALGVTANGGAGGITAGDTYGNFMVAGGAGGGWSGTVDFGVAGSDGGNAIVFGNSNVFFGGFGGGSYLGGSSRPSINTTGIAGKNYGGGGSASSSGSLAGPFVGGNGANGIVLLDLYA